MTTSPGLVKAAAWSMVRNGADCKPVLWSLPFLATWYSVAKPVLLRQHRQIRIDDKKGLFIDFRSIAGGQLQPTTKDIVRAKRTPFA